MDATLEVISPTYIGEKRIGVEVDPATELLTNRPIKINFTYDNTAINGFSNDVILPLELIVQPGFGDGGEGNGYQNKIFRRSKPNSYTFTVPSSGQYLVLLREQYHNRWYGSINIEITGDEFSRLITERS